MPGSNGSTEAEEGGTGSDDESGMRKRLSSPRWSGKTGRTKGWRLRGVEWRVKLGILPGGSATVDAMRRATADGRRRYADVRRRLLVDPHIMDDDQKPAHLRMDNPLSLDPESVWGRYFRNAELEKTIEKDLTRLYPEHGVFFQSAPCQAMMRRILLVWSLIHPQFSYRQGMHELLAPLLYVLHVDVVRLSQVKHRFEDLFDDRFDSLSLQEQHVRDKVESAKNFCGDMIIAGDSINFNETAGSSKGAPVDPEEQRVDLSVIVQGSDMYGVEGELGALLSARFLEHDAYCMLDALLGGQGGALAMAEYFTSSSVGGKPPVIEASAALFRTLAAADISLYTHLVELGVEPQFFALRWLRLLFGREFVLDDLLRVWDAIFEADNTSLYQKGREDISGIKISQRSALISSISVSMILYVRPALLGAPDATNCLQRLLNFPQVPDVRDLIESAKSLQLLAQAASKAPGPPVPRSARSSEIRGNGKHGKSGSVSPPTPQHIVMRHPNPVSSSPDVLRVSMSLPGSYWEEKWTHSVLQKKAPEDLFSPRASPRGRTEAIAVARGFDNLESEVSSTSGMLSRSTSEGRHQTVRLDSLSSNLSVRVFDFAQESSDDDGQEMLRRCGEPAHQHSLGKLMPDSTGNIATDSSCVRSESDGEELRDQSVLNQEEDLASLPTPSTPQREHPTEDRFSDESTQTSTHPSSSLGKVNHCDISSPSRVGSDAEQRMIIVERCEDSETVTSDISNGKDFMSQNCDVQTILDCTTGETALLVDVSPSVTDKSFVVDDLSSTSSVSLEGPADSLLESPPKDTGVQCPRTASDQLCEQNNVSVHVEQSVQDERRKDDPVDYVTTLGRVGLEKAETDSVEGENGVNVVSALLSSKSKPPLPPSRLGRFNWMWSLGRNSFGEKGVNNKAFKEESDVIPNVGGSVSDTDMSASTAANMALRRKKSWWRSNSEVVPEDSVATTSSDSGSVVDFSGFLVQVSSLKDLGEAAIMATDVKLKEDSQADMSVSSLDGAKRAKDTTSSTTLGALGQAVLEHVQVLEFALAQKVSVLGIENMMWTPAVRDKTEITNRTGLGSKGQGAALGAISELRKISQALQQM